jgi:hypothetical protein
VTPAPGPVRASGSTPVHAPITPSLSRAGSLAGDQFHRRRDDLPQALRQARLADVQPSCTHRSGQREKVRQNLLGEGGKATAAKTATQAWYRCRPTAFCTERSHAMGERSRLRNGIIL